MTLGDTCTIAVRYTPTGRVESSEELRIDYFNGISTEYSAVELQGRGMAPAELSITPATTNDFGTKANGSVSYLTFNLNYDDGDLPATSIAVNSAPSSPFSFRGGSFPGTGGNCGATLSNGSCTMVIQFSPTVAGAYNDSFTIQYFDALNNQTTSQTITGIGQAPAVLTVNRAGTHNMGTVQVGSSQDVTYTVTYFSGGVPAENIQTFGLSAPFNYKGGSFPGTGGTCTTTLSSGNCTIVVTFSPTTLGTFSGSMTLRYNNGVSNIDIPRGLAGNTEAKLNFSPATGYNFGSVLSGLSDEATFTVQNTGGTTATSITGSGLANPFVFKGGSFPGTGGDCSSTLTNGDSCSVVVTFSPNSISTFNDSVIVNYFDGFGVESATKTVTGTGSAPATLEINGGTNYNFGLVAVTDTVEVTLTVSHSGSSSATGISGSGFNNGFAFKGGSYPGTGGTCGTSISANCTIVITFTPASTARIVNDLNLSYNNGVVSQSATIKVIGEGQNVAVLTISETDSYDFGSIPTNTSREHTFTISHTGDFNATGVTGGGLSSPFDFKGGSYPGTGGTCGSTISAACTIVVTFNPTTSGVSNDTIQISYNDGKETQSATRAITGTGNSPAILTINSGSAYDFGDLLITNSLEATLTVTYSGETDATGVSGSGLSAPFAFKDGSYPGTGGTCGATISSNCTVVITFSPSSSGSKVDTMFLSYNDGINSQSANATLNGNALDPASLQINGGITHNFGDVAIADTSETTLTVSYTGDVDATGVTGSGLSAPFTFKGGSYPGTDGTCGGTISSDCTIVVTFNPSTSNISLDTIQIDYNDGLTSQSTTSDLNGRGRTVAVLTISETDNYDYGNVTTGTSSDHTFTISHSGQLNATGVTGSGISAPFSFKGGSYPGTGGDCGATISSACSIVVTFAPTAAVASIDAIDISYNDGKDNQSISRGITGTGVLPAALTTTTSSLIFGTLNTGSYQSLSLEVTNTGDSPASGFYGGNESESIQVIAKEGLTSNTCGKELAPGESCHLEVELQADRVGKIEDEVELKYFDGAKESKLKLTALATSNLNTQTQDLFNLLGPHELNSQVLSSDSIQANHRATSFKIDDITNDSISDLLTLSSTGKIRTQDAQSFETIYEIDSESRFLNRIILMNDSDQDGFDDFIIGSPLSEKRKGVISFYSSYFGDKRFEIVGSQQSFLGLSLHNIGDINGDNIDDIIFGEYQQIKNEVLLKKLHAIDGLYGEWLFEIKKVSK